MDNFRNIALTEDEIRKAILEAKKAKAAFVGENDPTWLERWTSEFWSRAAVICPEFRENEDNCEIVEKLIRYFSRDATVETEGICLNKGIMLAGPIGCGKTTIMKIFRSLLNIPLYDARQLCRTYGKYEDKDEFFMVYANYGNRDKQNPITIDDLGSEDLVVEWGNKTSVTAELIQWRYNRRLPTHFTTNLSGNEIGEFYGSRIQSRLREVVNYIAFPREAKDHRK